MSLIRRSSNNSNTKNVGIRSIRRRTNNASYQNFVPASSRFDDGTTNRIRKPLTDILNIDLQHQREQQEQQEKYQVQDSFNDDVRTRQDDYNYNDDNLIDDEDNEEEYNDDEVLYENMFESDSEEAFQGEIIEERDFQAKYNGNYAPYFPNATIFMLFTWCTKHMIG